MKPAIHVLGNSHVRNFIGRSTSGDDPLEDDTGELTIYVRQFGTTGATVFGLLNKNSQTGAGENIKSYISERSYVENVLIVLGDVDVREHFHRHPGTRFIDNAVERYEEFLSHITERVGKLFISECIPLSVAYYENYKDRDTFMNRLRFNCKVEAMCTRRGWTFFEYPREMTDMYGRLPNEHVCGYDGACADPQEPHMDYAWAKSILIPHLTKLIIPTQE